MSRIEVVLAQLKDMNPDEIEQVYKALLKRMDRLGKAVTAIKKLKGSASGVWDMDAQQYVNQLRADER